MIERIAWRSGKKEKSMEPIWEDVGGRLVIEDSGGYARANENVIIKVKKQVVGFGSAVNNSNSILVFER